MRGDERVDYDAALERARRAAYPAGEYVGQESLMRASEIRLLAARAGVGPGTSVLDLCCGTAGPGRLVTAELGCDYLGVDASPGAVALARERAGDLGCRFEVAHVPPLPPGPFDVVLVLETLLAFPDKDALLRAVAAALPVGGRFGLTVEEGLPLTRLERAAMPAADTVWPVPLPELISSLRRTGLRVRWLTEHTRSHRSSADGLVQAFLQDRAAIAARVGDQIVDDLVSAHRLWSAWLGSGRVRKFAVVAEKTAAREDGRGS
ncbi:MAG: class I SAM-dependent methyltransferase [Nocardioides sp.]